jgi:hypothetical protein
MQDLSGQETMQIIALENANEYGVSLTRQERDLDPSRLSGIIFARFVGTDAKDAKKTRACS